MGTLDSSEACDELSLAYGESILRAHDIRISPARIWVYCLLRRAHGDGVHLSVESLYRNGLSCGANFSLASAYRTLSEFERAGLVRKHLFGEEHRVYELVDCNN